LVFRLFFRVAGDGISRMQAQELVARYGSPLYVYDLDQISQRARALREAIAYGPAKLLYAIKANPAPAVVRRILAEGYGIDAVSPGEVAMALRLGVEPAQVLYTENNMTDVEMHAAIDQGVLINCGSLDRLQRLGEAGARQAAVRFNPDVGGGLHEKVCTAGPLTKFGVHHSQVEQVRGIEQATGIQVVGCHMHIGSGILDAELFLQAMQVILDVAAQLPHLRFIDFGGGIGIPYQADQQPMDLTRLGAAAVELMQDFCQRYGRELELHLEPGRYLVAEAGSLLCTVTAVKRTPDGRCFVGTDTGFNHLVRPAMYDSYHRIDNLSNPNGALQTVDVVGNICESGDIFARDRPLSEARVGDILAIRDTGAYGMSMASTYNLRPLPAEVGLAGGQATVLRPAQRIEDLLAQWDGDRE